MRFALILCALCLVGCDDEAFYADGTRWEPVMPKLLKNDALRLHPYLRRYPTNDQEWTRFIQTLNAQPAANLGNNVDTFTPTWTGFSTDPTGEISYMDLGAIVMMWVDANGTGTSDATDFSIAGIPDEIVPSVQRSLPIIVMDNGLEAPARMIVDTDGTAFFQRMIIDGSNLQYSTTAFTIGNVKGWVAGALVTYAK